MEYGQNAAGGCMDTLVSNMCCLRTFVRQKHMEIECKRASDRHY